MSKDNGGPAFPRVVEQPNGYMQAVEGMSLRDYFAAKAMQGFCASFVNVVRENRVAFLEGIGQSAYEVADSLLAERSKQ